MSGYKRPKTFKIDMDEPDKLLLETLTQRRRISQKELVGYYVQIDTEVDIYNPDWKARLDEFNKIIDKKLEESSKKVVRLEGECSALIYAEEFHWCVWGRDGKTPDKKKLAKDLGQAKEMCLACKKTLEIKLENESYQVKVRELETKLQEQSTKKFKIPQCSRGARLDKEGLAFEGCERSPGAPVSIEGYCKKIKKGMGCDWFKSRIVGVGTEA